MHVYIFHTGCLKITRRIFSNIENRNQIEKSHYCFIEIGSYFVVENDYIFGRIKL